MIFNLLRFLLLIIACSSLNPLIAAPKKCILFGIKDILLHVDIKKIKLGSLAKVIGYDAKKIQEFQDKLSRALVAIPVNNFTPSTNIYPTIVEAWLTDYLPNQEVYEKSLAHIEDQYSFLQRTQLKLALEYACTKKQATVFSPNNDMLNLAHRCQNTLCAIALCTSWNSELFENLIHEHRENLEFFDEVYISGHCGILAATPTFYKPIIDTYGKDNIVLIDSLPEDIDAAQSCGIKTITFTSAASAEQELKSIGFLS